MQEFGGHTGSKAALLAASEKLTCATMAPQAGEKTFPMAPIFNSAHSKYRYFEAFKKQARTELLSHHYDPPRAPLVHARLEW